MLTTLTRPETGVAERKPGFPNQSIEDIYTSVSAEVRAALYAFCGDAERALDATQEAFLRLQQMDLSAIRDPRAWLLHTGRNWLRDIARKHRRRPMSGPDHIYSLSDSRESAEAATLRSETSRMIESALSKMREPDRIALVLRYGMKWSAARIAETLECNPDAVDMRLCRARKRLREILLESDPDLQQQECSTMAV